MAFTTVKGEITRTFFDGKGAEVTESWQSNGDTMKKRWAAFFESAHGLSEGDKVSITGQHGDKIEPWEKDGETRHTIKRTLNRAKVDKPSSAPTTASQPPVETASDSWATPASYDNSETPF